MNRRPYAFEAWLQKRNKALRELDMEYARQLMPAASNDDVRLTALHKVRYECTDIDAVLRHQSGSWLRDRGFNRMEGMPLLPEGELPV